MLAKNWGEPMGAPAIFEKQIEIKLLHPASTLESRIQVKPILSGSPVKSCALPAILPLRPCITWPNVCAAIAVVCFYRRITGRRDQ
ncbi:MAG: hypothetical protein P8X89_16980 [Reinekea sp.]